MNFAEAFLAESVLGICDDVVEVELTCNFLPHDVFQQLATFSRQGDGSLICFFAPVSLFEDRLNHCVFPRLRDLACHFSW